MKKSKFSWKAFSSKNRIKLIDDIKKTIKNYGNIVHSNLFSDQFFTLSAEVDEDQIENLYKDLEKHTPLPKLDKLKLNLKSKKEAVVLLNILFAGRKDNIKNLKPIVEG